MGKLNLKPNLPQPDDIYQLLVDLHADCDESESHIRNAKMILCLANHIGDVNVIAQAVEIAKQQASEPNGSNT